MKIIKTIIFAVLITVFTAPISYARGGPSADDCPFNSNAPSCTPASMEKIDLKVALKILPLLTKKISGDVVAAVIYDAKVAESKIDAEKIKALIDEGIETPKDVKLTSFLMGSNELGKMSDAKIAFLAAGIPPATLTVINKATSDAGVLSISTNLDYVKANKCIIGVMSKPTVQIFYSKTASDAGKISFSPAFNMLVITSLGDAE